MWYSEKSIKKAGFDIVATFFNMPGLGDMQRFGWVYKREVRAFRLKSGCWAICLVGA